MSLVTALMYSLLGLAIVFFALVLLMVIIKITVALTDEKPSAKSVTEKPTAANAPVAAEAPGTAGEVLLYDTPPAEAAMVMAIVADSLKKPLNELRFISIKEIKE